ncbi:response regulator transcription factor [Sulfoacidibacillus thermotolerans]|uniref:DNA-binding response regulator n=1 Tax=Sulfoacidibacillus thermotolerans TaxID=1765684 RepID=A0A2U3D7R2_SULT2|nr:response regulator transcription factor [Sulfoacidibacillus thermotolerans]PWI57303.1 DNA-binding response regulator [Sulfoacidibacillus thermotolerans]
MRVLVIEDNVEVASVIESALQEEKWETDVAHDGRQGLEKALQEPCDVIILDIMLPDLDGHRVLQEIRKVSFTTPVLFLTARDRVEDRVIGLDYGADDYLTKPFDVAELLARVRALARRKGSIYHEDHIAYGRIQIRPQAHDGFVDNKPLHLTVKEYELLEYFLINAEQILTRQQIFYRVWGFNSDSGSTVVDVYVHYLRKKLAPFHCDEYVRTVRGVGFMLKES